MGSVIILRPEHKKYHAVTSPLLQGVEQLTSEEIEARVQAHLDNPCKETRDAAIMAFGSIIRHITGRYIGNFRSLVSMEDDLISVSFGVVIKAIDGKQPSHDICRIVSNRILNHQTKYINKYRTAASLSETAQRRRLKNGEEVHYAVPIDDTHVQTSMDESLVEFEFYESLQSLDLSDLERELLRPHNWGRTTREIAKDLGLPHMTVHRAVTRLLTMARELIYAD